MEAILREPVAMRRAEFCMDCKVEIAVVGALGNQTGWGSIGEDGFN